MYITPQENVMETMLRDRQPAGDLLTMSPGAAETNAYIANASQEVATTQYMAQDSHRESIEYPVFEDLTEEQVRWIHDVTQHIPSVLRSEMLGYTEHGQHETQTPGSYQEKVRTTERAIRLSDAILGFFSGGAR